MIVPTQDENILLAEINGTHTESNSFACWSLGHLGLLVKWADKHLLMFPSLSFQPTMQGIIDPAHLDFLDVVTVGQYDADQPNTAILGTLLKANPNLKILLPEAVRSHVAAQIKCDPVLPIGIDAVQSRDIRGFKFWAIAAAPEEDEHGQYYKLGYIVQFGGFSIYQGGDVVLNDNVLKALETFPLDVAYLPINAKQVVEFGKALGAQYVVPSQYAPIDFNMEELSDFEKAAKKVGQEYKLLRNGEGVRFQTKIS